MLRVRMVFCVFIAFGCQIQQSLAYLSPFEVFFALKNGYLQQALLLPTSNAPSMVTDKLRVKFNAAKDVIKTIACASMISSMVLFGNAADATSNTEFTSLPVAEFISIDGRKPAKAVRPYAYSVEMFNPPILQPRTHPGGEESLLNRLSKADYVLLGEHTSGDLDSLQADRQLERDLIKGMQQKSGNRRVNVYVAALPNTLEVQSAITTYQQSKTESPANAWSDLEARLSSESGIATNKLQGLRSIFELPKVDIYPLGPSPAVIERAATEGLNDLSDEEKLRLVPKPELFVELTKDRGFQKYADRALSALYSRKNSNNNRIDDKSGNSAAVKEAVVEGDRQRFVGARMLKHEAIAAELSRSIYDTSNSKLQKKDGLNIALLDQEDTSFGFGVEERLKRHFAPPNAKIYSVLLNPTADDSFSNTVALRLSLEYGDDELPYQRPLADFLWFGPEDEEHMPAVKLLTRMKNPIGREGDKPPGESSILGVF